MTEQPVQTNYAGIEDEALALLAQKGDEDAERQLVERFMPLVRLKSRPYFLIGADSADLVQEGAIGLCEVSEVEFEDDGHAMAWAIQNA